MWLLASSFCFNALPAIAAENPLEVPNIWNTALSGFAVVLVPVVLRVFWLRPKLNVTFDVESDDLARNIAMPVSNAVARIQNWVRLRVTNSGMMALTNPRIWCLGMSIGDSGPLPFPVTPFELSWSETDRDFQIGAVLPGNYLYRLDLGYVDTALVRSGSLEKPARDKFIVSRRNQQETVALDAGPTYDLCLVISNENILVPAHFIHVQVKWTQPPQQNSELPQQPMCSVKIIDQGNYWRAKRSEKLKRFETN